MANGKRSIEMKRNRKSIESGTHAGWSLQARWNPVCFSLRPFRPAPPAMKNTVISLLVSIFLVVLVNLLIGLGVIGKIGGGAGSDHEYQVLSAQQMDNIGFRAVAEQEGIEVTESGEINFPKEMVDKISKVNLLPRTILEVEKDGGWAFVAATNDNHYIFKRDK
jgi:hypothetical protein